MDQIFSEIGSALGGSSAARPSSSSSRRIAIYLVVLWLAGAYWAFRDMQQRTGEPDPAVRRGELRIILSPRSSSPSRSSSTRSSGPTRRSARSTSGTWPRRRSSPRSRRSRAVRPAPAGERRVDHLPDPAGPPQPGLPELQPPRRARLVAVRVVRQGLRAPRAAAAGPDRRRPADATGRVADGRGPRPRPTVGPARIDRQAPPRGSPPEGSSSSVDPARHGAALPGPPGPGRRRILSRRSSRARTRIPPTRRTPPTRRAVRSDSSVTAAPGARRSRSRAAPPRPCSSSAGSHRSRARAIVVGGPSGGSRAPSSTLSGPSLLALGLIAAAGNRPSSAGPGRAYAGPSPFLVFAAMIPSRS